MGSDIDDAPSVLQEWSDYLSLRNCENNSSFFHLYIMRRHSFFRLYSRWVAERSRALLRQNFNLRRRQVSLILFPFLVNDLQCQTQVSHSYLQGKEITGARLFGWGSTDCNAWGNKNIWNKIMRVSCHTQLDYVSAWARPWTFIVSEMDSVEWYPRAGFGHFWMSIALALSALQQIVWYLLLLTCAN